MIIYLTLCKYIFKLYKIGKFPEKNISKTTYNKLIYNDKLENFSKKKQSSQSPKTVHFPGWIQINL